jgi:murein DD-endopeptidase MepM/ murein hydrolase activator NlpD
MQFPLRVMRLRHYSFGQYRPRAGTRGLGVRTDCNGHPRRHLGWDLLAPIGTPVFAVCDGWVTWRGYVKGYGLLLQFKFELRGRRYYALYGHLSSAAHGLAWVKEGTVLGHTGISGWEADARHYRREHHLHFEIRSTASLSKLEAGTLHGTLDPGKVLGSYMYPYVKEPVPAQTIKRQSRNEGLLWQPVT